jgi:hypothetical protein
LSSFFIKSKVTIFTFEEMYMRHPLFVTFVEGVRLVD